MQVAIRYSKWDPFYAHCVPTMMLERFIGKIVLIAAGLLAAVGFGVILPALPKMGSIAQGAGILLILLGFVMEFVTDDSRFKTLGRVWTVTGAGAVLGSWLGNEPTVAVRLYVAYLILAGMMFIAGWATKELLAGAIRKRLDGKGKITFALWILAFASFTLLLPPFFRIPTLERALLYFCVLYGTASIVLEAYLYERHLKRMLFER